MEHKLYQSHTLQTGDWTPITVRQAPKKVATKEEISSNIAEFVKEFVTKEFLFDFAQKQFDGSFEKKHIGSFIAAVASKLSSNEDVIAKLEEKGLKWKDVAKSVNDEAKSFFVKQMEEGL